MGYNLEKKMFALLIVAASVLSVSAQPFSLTFTGDVEVDFPESQNAQNKDFASGKYEIQTVADAFDVGVPPGISQSGWDIKDMRFQYDYANDALHIGLNCFGVCGDADGDGDEGRSGAVLTDNGGVDLPNFLNSETCAVAIDVGTAGTNMPDGQFDFALGYPAENNGDNVFPCGNQFGSDCFGLYRFNNADASQTMVAQIGKLFLWDPNDATLTQARANGWAINHTPLTTAQKPDLEWTLNDYNMIWPATTFRQSTRPVCKSLKSAWRRFAARFKTTVSAKTRSRTPVAPPPFASRAKCLTRVTCAAAMARRVPIVPVCRTARTATMCATCAPATVKRVSIAPARRLVKRMV